MMRAKEIMTRNVKMLRPSTKVDEAIDFLVKNNVSGAPVVDDKGKLLGMVTEKDLLVSLDFLGKRNAAEISVEEFMSKDVVTFTENAPFEEISQALVRRNIQRVPIVRDGLVVGIISRLDVLRGFRKNN